MFMQAHCCSATQQSLNTMMTFDDISPHIVLFAISSLSLEETTSLGEDILHHFNYTILKLITMIRKMETMTSQLIW